MIALSITGAVVTYIFIGFTSGIMVHRTTKESNFWDEEFAAALMFLFWPLTIPGIYLNKAAHRTADILETRAEQKKLPKATVEKS